MQFQSWSLSCDKDRCICNFSNGVCHVIKIGVFAISVVEFGMS